MRPAQDAAATVLPGAAGDDFNAGPSIGDLPQDEVPARMLFVRNLSPATHPSELQHAFEVSARPPDPLLCNPSSCRCSCLGRPGCQERGRISCLIPSALGQETMDALLRAWQQMQHSHVDLLLHSMHTDVICMA